MGSVKIKINAIGAILVIVGLSLGVGAAALDYQRSLSGEVSDSHHHAVEGDEAGEVQTHGTEVWILSVSGVGLIGLGLFAMRRYERRDERTVLTIAVFLMLTDGIIHLIALNEHLEVTVIALFFLGVGIAQIAMSPALLGNWRFVLPLSILVTVVLIVLFIVTRFLAPPFHDEPEPVEALGLVSKAIEVALLGLLVYMSQGQARTLEQRGNRKTIVA